MLDVITKGRVISGMVVGTGMEYFSYNINPTYPRERGVAKEAANASA